MSHHGAQVPSSFLTLIGASLFATTIAAQQLPPLYPAQITLSPQGALDVALGDLNGDGLKDAATSAYGASEVVVLWGAGDGRFVPGPLLPLFKQARVVQLGDFEGDGDLDVLTVNLGSSVTVVRGDGHGGFAPVKSSPNPGNPGLGAFGDLDGDGDLDAFTAHSNTGGGGFTVMLGDATASFTAQPAIGASGGLGEIVLGDLDLDGDLDACAGSSTAHTLLVVRGNGGGSFSAPQSFNVTLAPGALALADFDGNGRPDLAAIVGDNVRILKSLPGGTFALGGSFATGFVGANDLATADLNHDGGADVLVGSDVGLNLLAGNGAGSLGAPQASNFLQVVDRMALGELNGDGQLDVVCADGAKALTILLGDESGVPQTNASIQLPSGNGTVLAVLARDVNGDGLGDITAASASSDPDHVFAYLALPGGGFAEPTSTPVKVYPRALTSQDFDENGALDLAVSCDTPPCVQVLAGGGDGSFTASAPYFDGSWPSGLATADFDLDGHADLATANMAVNGSIFLGAGDGTLTLAGQVNFPDQLWSITTADFDLDGVPDLLVTVDTTFQLSALQLARGVGDGSFVVSSIPVSTSGFGLGATDLNADGAPDIVFTTDVDPGGTPGMLATMLGDGAGGFASPVAQQLKHHAVSLAIGDFNGDAVPDVATPSSEEPAVVGLTGYVGVYLGNGDGTLALDGGFAAGDSAYSCASGDLDGDGATDLVVGHGQSFSSAPSLTVLMNRRLGPDFPWVDLGHGLAGNATPRLTGTGTLVAGSPGLIELSDAAPSAPGFLFVALAGDSKSFKGGTLVAWPPLAAIPLTTAPGGGLELPWTAWPAAVADLQLALQFALVDAGAPKGVALSNGLQASVP